MHTTRKAERALRAILFLIWFVGSMFLLRAATRLMSGSSDAGLLLGCVISWCVGMVWMVLFFKAAERLLEVGWYGQSRGGDAGSGGDPVLHDRGVRDVRRDEGGPGVRGHQGESGGQR